MYICTPPFERIDVLFSLDDGHIRSSFLNGRGVSRACGSKMPWRRSHCCPRNTRLLNDLRSERWWCQPSLAPSQGIQGAVRLGEGAGKSGP